MGRGGHISGESDFPDEKPLDRFNDIGLLSGFEAAQESHGDHVHILINLHRRRARHGRAQARRCAI